MSGPGNGGVTPRSTGKASSSSTTRSSTQSPTRSGTISKTYSSKGSNTSSGSKTGSAPHGETVLNEKQANVMEQGTGRRRVVQEMGSTVDNSR